MSIDRRCDSVGAQHNYCSINDGRTFRKVVVSLPLKTDFLALGNRATVAETAPAASASATTTTAAAADATGNFPLNASLTPSFQFPHANF